jgi:hypothetical protein
MLVATGGPAALTPVLRRVRRSAWLLILLCIAIQMGDAALHPAARAATGVAVR